MVYILLTLVSEILLISCGGIMCFVMPEYYKSKSRTAIVGVGIFLAIVCLILNGYADGKWGYVQGYRIYSEYKMFYIAHIIFQIAICCYLLFASIKIHLKLLNLVIATSEALKVMSYILLMHVNLIQLYQTRKAEFFDRHPLVSIWWYHVQMWLVGITFLTFVIILILLIYVKYDGTYSAPDEIQEYKPLEYCPQCGKPVDADKNFCTNCGAKVK
jgi:hypothetical protein